MKVKYIIRTAVNGLRARKGRSLLTILGIVIGVMAVILVKSIGNSAEILILNNLQALGNKVMSVEPGQNIKGLTDFFEYFAESLKERDLYAIRNPDNVRGLDRATPMVVFVDSIIYGNESMHTNIYGSGSSLTDLFDIFPREGYMFTDEDIKLRSSVAVIGSEVKEQLFGNSNALGEKIKIRGRTFRVIGVLPPKGQVFVWNLNKIVFIPYTTAQYYLLGTKHFNLIMLRAVSESMVPIVKEDVNKTLRELHGITDPEKDDFSVQTLEDVANRFSIASRVLNILLICVAAISLLVGGIGIMNIMLVSVTERTKEIGLRKSIGATNGDIMRQFLLESIMLTFIGGLLGVFLGGGLGWLTTFALKKFGDLNWVFEFPISAVVIGVSLSVIVGIVFGLYPATQAAKKNPIEALRYE